MSERKQSERRPLLPGIIFVVICVTLGIVILKGPQKDSAPNVVTSPTTNLAATNFGQAMTNAAAAPSDEDRVAALITEGNQFLTKGDFASAVQKFEQAAAISPEQEDIRYNLAIALAKLGKREEAKKQYEEALRIFPEYAEALNNLGNLLMTENKLDEAVQHFRDAVKNAPENASFHNNLGTALGRQKKTDEAMAEFEEAVKKDPTYVEARVNLANALLATGRADEAIPHLNEALRLKPNFAPALQTMQRARQRLGK
jgi:tetratricopeptide (TPR) repeat protein